MNRIVFIGVALLLIVAGCSSSDPTASDEYVALEQELAQTKQELAQAETQLAQVVADRDELTYQATTSANRSEKSTVTVETLGEIINNPDSFGTRNEVLDLLMTMHTNDAVMDDTAFGAVPMRSAWANTLWGSGATIKTWAKWMCEDGSQSGSLWTWAGESKTGEPFELIGVNIDDYDEEGRVTYSLVDWPYEASYVLKSHALGNAASD